MDTRKFSYTFKFGVSSIGTQTTHSAAGVLDALPYPAAVVTVDGVIEAVNPRWTDRGAQEPSSLFARPAGESVVAPPTPADASAEPWRAALAQGLQRVAAGDAAEHAQPEPFSDRPSPDAAQVVLRPFTDHDGTRRLLLALEPASPGLGPAARDDALYRTVVEEQVEMICRFLPDTTLTFVNDAYCRYFDRSREELIGRRFIELIPESDRAPLLEGLAGFTPDRPSTTYDHQVTRRDGTLGWHSWTDRAFFDGAGRATGFQAVGRDITPLKNTEAALRESETRFLQLSTHLSEVFWIFDWRTRRMLHVSSAFESVFGRPVQQVLDDARQWIESVHPEDRSLVNAAFRSADREAFDQTYRVIQPDGGLRWVRDRGYPVEDEAGAVVRIVGVAEDITERVVADERRRLSEERYHAAAEAGLDAFFLLDAVRDADGEIIDFVFVDLNARGAEMVSRQRDEVVGQRLCEQFPVNRSEGFFDRYKNVVLTREAHYNEFSINAHEQGIAVSWMEHQVVPVGDGVAISARDITARKRAEQEIVRQREETQTILDALPAFVFYKDAHNRILRVNRAVCEAQGLPASEIEGKHSAELYPDQADAFYADDLAVMQSGKPKLGYVENITVADGEERWIRTDKVPVFADDGTPEGVIAIAMDVTELKQTAEMLRISEQRFRDLFERVPVAVIEHDLSAVGNWFDELRAQGVEDLSAYLEEDPESLAAVMQLTRIRSANQAACELFGADSVEELSAAIHSGRVTPGRAPLSLKLGLIWNGQRSAEIQTQYRALGGRVVNVLLRIEVPMTDGRPDLRGVILAMTDISANRQRVFAEAQVDQAQRERKAMVSELHDTLGQQLTGLNMLAESLRRKVSAASPESADRVAELASLAGEANREVRRIISGLSPEPVRPDGLEEALDSLARATELVHELPVEFNCPRPPVDLTEEQANHLLFIAREAIHNAAKHARAKHVRLDFEQDDAGISLRVSDDGIGIPPKPTPDSSGGGLGLGIMRYRAEAIGATISFDAPPAGGTTVRCLLPMSSEPPFPSPAEDTPS